MSIKRIVYVNPAAARVVVTASLLSLSLWGSASNADSYLKVGNYVQMTDWSSGTTINSSAPDVYSAVGPIFNDTGLMLLNSVSAQAKGRADYGALGFFAYASAPTSNTSDNAWGGAQFVDVLTVDGAALNGTAGSMNVWVDLDGAIVGAIGHPGVSPGAGWTVGFVGDYSSTVGSWDYSVNAGRQSYHGYLARTKPFIFGQPFEFGISFTATAGYPYGESLVDYYNTVTLNMGATQFLDAGGSPVDGVSLVSGSGHDYFVPEPETSALVLAGLGLLGFSARCRKNALHERAAARPSLDRLTAST